MLVAPEATSSVAAPNDPRGIEATWIACPPSLEGTDGVLEQAAAAARLATTTDV
jgi:hypothetical protein